MLIRDHMARSGETLFRWRSFVLLAFAPAIIWAVLQGEQVEAWLGEAWGEAFETLAMALVIAGQVGRILTVGFVPRGTSGRNTGGQVASRLNMTGVYSVVRNPLYLFNCMMYLGIVLYAQSLWLAAIFVLVLVPYYERIIAAEEAFLSDRFGEAYTTWAARTPAFIPRLGGFVAPDMPFSWRTVLRREHASIFAAILVLYAITVAQHWGNLGPEFLWAHGLMALAAVAEVTVIFLKKRTTHLNVAGR